MLKGLIFHIRCNAQTLLSSVYFGKKSSREFQFYWLDPFFKSLHYEASRSFCTTYSCPDITYLWLFSWKDRSWIVLVLVSPFCLLIFQLTKQGSFLLGQFHFRVIHVSLVIVWFSVCRPEYLKRQFGQFGPVKDVYLPRDYYTGWAVLDVGFTVLDFLILCSFLILYLII